MELERIAAHGLLTRLIVRTVWTVLQSCTTKRPVGHDGRRDRAVEFGDDSGRPLHLLGAHAAPWPHADGLSGLHVPQSLQHPPFPAPRAARRGQLLPSGARVLYEPLPPPPPSNLLPPITARRFDHHAGGFFCLGAQILDLAMIYVVWTIAALCGNFDGC